MYNVVKQLSTRSFECKYIMLICYKIPAESFARNACADASLCLVEQQITLCRFRRSDVLCMHVDYSSVSIV